MARQFKTFLKEAVVLLILVIATSVAVNLYKTRNTVTGPAPSLDAVTIFSDPVSLSVQNRQQPVLVHFWATWCPVCSLEHDSIDAIAKDYPVITIAMQSGSREALVSFMQENRLTFPVVEDDAGEIARQWQVRGVPASFILSPAGEIRFVEVGYTSEIGLRLRLWWAGRKR